MLYHKDPWYVPWPMEARLWPTPPSSEGGAASLPARQVDDEKLLVGYAYEYMAVHAALRGMIFHYGSWAALALRCGVQLIHHLGLPCKSCDQARTLEGSGRFKNVHSAIVVASLISSAMDGYWADIPGGRTGKVWELVQLVTVAIVSKYPLRRIYHLSRHGHISSNDRAEEGVLEMSGMESFPPYGTNFCYSVAGREQINLGGSVRESNRWLQVVIDYVVGVVKPL